MIPNLRVGRSGRGEGEHNMGYLLNWHGSHVAGWPLVGVDQVTFIAALAFYLQWILFRLSVLFDLQKINNGLQHSEG